MNDLHLRARHYFLEIESSRLPVRRRLLLGAFVAICLVGFLWGIVYFFGTLFSDWPKGKASWPSYLFALACELLIGGAFLYSVWRNHKTLLQRYQAMYPDKQFKDVDQVRTFFLETLTGCLPDEFFSQYKEVAAVQAALKASSRSPTANSRELSSLIYDPESKARIWTLSSIFCSVFSALALAKLTEPGDFVALMTRQGWELYKVLFATALMAVGSTLFFAYLIQDTGRIILAWTLARFSHWGVGRDDVLNYFARDLLRLGRTKLPDLSTVWPLVAPQTESSASAEVVDEQVAVEPCLTNAQEVRAPVQEHDYKPEH